MLRSVGNCGSKPEYAMMKPPILALLLLSVMPVRWVYASETWLPVSAAGLSTGAKHTIGATAFYTAHEPLSWPLTAS